MKIIARVTSMNVSWGINGLTEKMGWEDLRLYYEDDESIGMICLETNDYLKSCIEDLKENPTRR